jgi:hypothetical protein
MLPLTLSASCKKGLGRVSPWVLAIACLVLAMPVLQLIPLPPAIWQALPGREIEIQALSLMGADKRFMPLSVAPERTFASLLAMVVPVLYMIQISRLDHIGRSWMFVTVVAMVICSILLGVMQLSRTGGFVWSFYSHLHAGYIFGFNADHNAEADLLHIGLLSLSVLVATVDMKAHSRALIWTTYGILAVAIVLAIVMTGSRTGILLMAISAPSCLAILWDSLRRDMALSLRQISICVCAILSLVCAAALLLWNNPAVQNVIMRFYFVTEGRGDIWRDSAFALRGVWPWGGGIGSFPRLYNAAERLETVSLTFAGRAHCDWLEWTIECGLPGLVVLSATLGIVLAMIGTGMVRTLRAEPNLPESRAARAQILMSCALLLILGAHSINEFPLRAMSIACMAGLATAILTPTPYLEKPQKAPMT